MPSIKNRVKVLEQKHSDKFTPDPLPVIMAGSLEEENEAMSSDRGGVVLIPRCYSKRCNICPDPGRYGCWNVLPE